VVTASAIQFAFALLLAVSLVWRMVRIGKR
jgi:hypothetical protein